MVKTVRIYKDIENPSKMNTKQLYLLALDQSNIKTELKPYHYNLNNKPSRNNFKNNNPLFAINNHLFLDSKNVWFSKKNGNNPIIELHKTKKTFDNNHKKDDKINNNNIVKNYLKNIKKDNIFYKI